MQVMESKETMARLGSDPYYLVQGAKGSDTVAPVLPFWCAPVQRWCGPFVMEAINSKVVHRSNALAQYGPDFKFREAMQVGGCCRGCCMCAAGLLARRLCCTGLLACCRGVGEGCIGDHCIQLDMLLLPGQLFSTGSGTRTINH